MSNLELFVAPTEFKFVGDAQPGVFEGHGSVFDILDSHKDLVRPGAFAETLAEQKAKGILPGMYVEHSAYDGGDPLPVGVWTDLSEDSRGLKGVGKISALDTDHGRRIHSLMKDGALTGLSIAFSVPPGGAMMGKKQGEPRRTLNKIKLYSVDIVRNPSNSAARISELKSAFRGHLRAVADPNDIEPEDTFTGPDVEDAIECLAAAIVMQDKLMSAGYGYGGGSVKDAAMLMTSLQSAYEALTGDCVPDGLTGWCKSAPITLRAIRTHLVDELGLSRKRADDVAKILFGSLPRDEGSNKAKPSDMKSAISDLRASLSGLPSLSKS